MPLGWLSAQVDPVVTGLLVALYAVATVVHPLWTVSRIRRGAPVFRYRPWFMLMHLVLFMLLVTVVPGIGLANLGLGWPAGVDWPAGVGFVAVFVVVFIAGSYRHYGLRQAAGSYLDEPRPDLPDIAEKAIGSSRDALLFIAMPLFLGRGVFELPLTWVVIGVMAGYGFHHLGSGPVDVVLWTGVAGVAQFVYLLSGHVALPAAVIFATALIPDYSWPRSRPPAEPVVPPLTMIEPPAPLR